MIHLRRHTEASSQQSFLRNVCLGTGPACKHEGDLVHKICNVVDHIEVDLIHGSEEVAEIVAKRVNRPAQRDDEAHVVERARDGRAAIFNRATCFASEDLEEEDQNSATQKPPEHRRACVLASSLEDQVELNHLQWHCDAPVHVTVNDGGLVNLHPILTHVHVMHPSHQCNQTAHVQARFPVVADGCCFREEEHGCCDHSDGDDPKGDCNTVIWLQKGIRRLCYRLRA